MNDQIKAMIKQQVTQHLKEFMAKDIDEKELIEILYIIHNAHKEGECGIWFRWYIGHPAAITIQNIKAGINGNPRNRGYMYECIEATINDNSLVVNFS